MLPSSDRILGLSREAIERMVAEAQESGVPVYRLSSDARLGREGLFNSMRRQLPLDPPVSSDRSWDAMADSLWSGLDLQAQTEHLIVWDDADHFAAADWREYEMAIAALGHVCELLADPVATLGQPKKVTVVVPIPSQAWPS